jgi:branched-chain amino acid transport system ATP-binding protein
VEERGEPKPIPAIGAFALGRPAVCAMTEAVLTADNVTIRYGGAVLAIEEVTLELANGKAVVLLGANGAGKTTVLRAFGGLLGFHSGEVTAGRLCFAGKPIRGGDPAALVSAGMAQTLEGRRIFQELTVLENLRLGAFPRRARAAIRASLEHVLELFPRLDDRLEQKAGTLSGGEQQMLAIGRALMARPRVLMLDEPSLGLAPIIVAEITAALRQLVEGGLSLLLADQNTSLASRVADYAYLLETGHVAASGEAAALLRDSTVRASYLGTGESVGARVVEGRAP